MRVAPFPTGAHKCGTKPRTRARVQRHGHATHTCLQVIHFVAATARRIAAILAVTAATAAAIRKAVFAAKAAAAVAAAAVKIDHLVLLQIFVAGVRGAVSRGSDRVRQLRDPERAALAKSP